MLFRDRGKQWGQPQEALQVILKSGLVFDLCEAVPFSLHNCVISHTKRSKKLKSTSLYMQH